MVSDFNPCLMPVGCDCVDIYYCAQNWCAIAKNDCESAHRANRDLAIVRVRGCTEETRFLFWRHHEQFSKLLDEPDQNGFEVGEVPVERGAGEAGRADHVVHGDL